MSDKAAPDNEALTVLLAAPEVVALGPPQAVFLESQEPEWMLRYVRPLVGPPPKPEAAVVAVIGCTAMFLIGVVGAVVLKFSAVSVAFPLLMLCGIGYGVWMYLDAVKALRPLKAEELVAFAICPQGLGCWRSGAWATVRWDEVAEVAAVMGHVRLVAHDGRNLVLEDCRLMDPRDRKADAGQRFLGLANENLQEIERLAYAPVLERASAALEAGQTVSFGPLGLSQHGLTFQGKALGWGEIGRLEIHSPSSPTGGPAHGLTTMRLRIGEVGKPSGGLFSRGEWWFDEPFLPLPNHAVLLALLGTRLQGVSVSISPGLGVVMPWYRQEFLARATRSGVEPV
jgi:hypothetical protein